MNPIFLWWLTLGALIGFVLAWIWDWLWFRARRRAVSVDIDTQVSSLVGERDRLAADLRACGDRRTALEGELTTARAGLGELDGLRGRFGELERVNAQLRAELDAANARIVEPQSTPPTASLALGATSDDGQTVNALRDYNLSMYDELEATRRTLTRFAPGRGDPLIDIDGIGPVYQNKLYDSGVVSFEQLAAMHPDRIRSLVAPNATFELNTESWIEQARRMAGAPVRDPLIDINGVGPVYEQRLLNAGITSFQQLSQMTPDELRAIINPEPWQQIDPESWIAEARLLAAQVAAGTYRKGEY